MAAPPAPPALTGITGVAVIGAGIVGAAIALALTEAGHEVTVIDPTPGEGASFGNAGAIAIGAVTPNATPGLIRQLPRMAFNRQGAGWVRRGDLLAALPWTARMIAASHPARVAAIARVLSPLTAPALAAHQKLAALAQCPDLIAPGGWLKVYGTADSFAGTALDRELMQRHGVSFDILDAAALSRRLPGVRPDALHRAIDQPGCGFAPDPGALVQAYLQGAQTRGARLQPARVRDIRRKAGHVLMTTTATPIAAAQVVICAGAASAALAARVGDHVPLLAERGYHARFEPGTEAALPGPTLFSDLGFVLAPMREGLRLTMGAELARHGHPPDPRRLRARIEAARQLVPELAHARVLREWMGERPSLPDSLPVLGPASADRRVFHAFGHAHLGLTMAGVTAYLIRDMIRGYEPATDLAPYSAGRFRHRAVMVAG